MSISSKVYSYLVTNHKEVLISTFTNDYHDKQWLYQACLICCHSYLTETDSQNMAKVAAIWRGERGINTRGRSWTKLSGGAWCNRALIFLFPASAGGNLARKPALLPFLRLTSDKMTGLDNLRGPLSPWYRDGDEQSFLHCCQTLWCRIS